MFLQNFSYFVMLGIALLAAVTDYRSGKIYNWLSFPAIFLGFFFSIVFLHHTFSETIFGFLMAFFIFMPLFFFRVFGAGDGKLMMAFGAFLGSTRFFDFFALTVLITALGAVALLVKYKRVSEFLKQVKLFAWSVFGRGLVVQWPKLREDIKAPFGISILIAFLVEFTKSVWI